MHGWRGRIGLIIASSDITIEPEFNRYTPPGVAVHAARMHLEDIVDMDTLTKMENDVERCCKLLNTAGVDVISYGCTTGSLVKGLGYDEEIEDKIQDTVEVPAVATAASVRRAFDTLGVNSITITTPYGPELNDLERSFFEKAGYDVVNVTGLGHTSSIPMQSETPQTAYREAKAADTPETDCIFISCTGYRTFEIIETLEQDLGKPVVTSNQATLWDTLGELGISLSSIDLGILFED